MTRPLEPVDRLIKAAKRARLSRWQIVVREVDGREEAVLVVGEPVPEHRDEAFLG